MPMTNQPRFGEVLTAMVTPFASDGSSDVAAARRLAVYLIEHGSDGLVLAGTTGESPTLSHDEKLALFEGVLEEVGDRAKIIAGTGSSNTAETIELTKEAAALGVDACLVVTPYYSKPPQNGLLAHYRAIADAVDVPLVLYDVPPRTSRRIERPTVVELAGIPNIVADKDAVGDPSETAKLRAELDAAGHTDFDLYSGDDVMLLPQMAAGCVGVVSVCSHVIGPQIKQIFSAWNDGKIDEAQRIFAQHLELISVLMGVTTSPIPVKYAIGLLGLEVGEPRLPLVPPTDDEARTIRSAMEKIGLL